MAALSVVLIGVGVFLMYDAYKNATPAPLAKARAAATTPVPATKG